MTLGPTKSPAPTLRLPGAVPLMPTIEHMLGFTCFLTTEERVAMIRERRSEELEALVEKAQVLRDSLRRAGSS